MFDDRSPNQMSERAQVYYLGCSAAFVKPARERREGRLKSSALGSSDLFSPHRFIQNSTDRGPTRPVDSPGLTVVVWSQERLRDMKKDPVTWGKNHRV